MKNIKFGLEQRLIYDLDKKKICLYGYTKGQTCKNCKNFYHEKNQNGTKNYSRCKLNPKKHWPAKLVACSLYEK